MTQSPSDPLATRASLLGRLKNWDDTQSWQEFSRTYSRLIRGVAIQSGLTESEAKDVEQDTLLCVAKTIHEFESDPKRGSFKGWLLKLTRWRIADVLRKRLPGGALSGETRTDDRTSTVNRVPEAEVLDAVWEKEWQKGLVDAALARVSRRVKAKHFQVFDLYALRRWPAAKVARELDINLVHVYLVNHRITKLIRQEVASLERK